MATETYFNDFGTTLNGSIDNSQTSITLNNVSAYPNPFTGLQCHIRIDDEIMLVTAVNTSTNVLTVVRGQETTTALNHANNSQVVQILTAAGLSQIVNQNGTNVVGAHASLPGSQTYSGQSYWATDRPYINIWNGSSYTQYYTEFASTPPVAASWTQINFSGGATLTDTAAGVNITATATGQKCAVVAAPATPYKVAMHFKMAIASNDSNAWCGAYWTTNTTSTSPFVMAVIRGNGNYTNYNGTSVSSPSFTSIYDPGGPTTGMHGNDFYIVLGDDGTNRTIYNSCDGYNYVVASGWPRARTENSGMNNIGFGYNGGALGTITLVSYRVF